VVLTKLLDNPTCKEAAPVTANQAVDLGIWPAGALFRGRSTYRDHAAVLSLDAVNVMKDPELENLSPAAICSYDRTLV